MDKWASAESSDSPAACPEFLDLHWAADHELWQALPNLSSLSAWFAWRVARPETPLRITCPSEVGGVRGWSHLTWQLVRNPISPPGEHNVVWNPHSLALANHHSLTSPTLTSGPAFLSSCPYCRHPAQCRSPSQSLSCRGKQQEHLVRHCDSPLCRRPTSSSPRRPRFEAE